MAEKPKIEEGTEEEAAKIKADKAAAKEGKKEASEKKGDGEEAEEEEEDKVPPPEGNGGKTDKYTWTQTLNALEVFVAVKPGVKAKQIVCDIGVSTLKVGLKGEEM